MFSNLTQFFGMMFNNYLGLKLFHVLLSSKLNDSLKTTDLVVYLGLRLLFLYVDLPKSPGKLKFMLADRKCTQRRNLTVFCLPTASDKF